MTRVLIISYYFAPQNVIGAVRPTKLAKYLQRQGCEVTVLCGTGLEPWRADPTLERDLEELKDVRVIRECSPLRAFKSRKQAAADGQGDNGAGAERDKQTLKARMLDAAYRWLRRYADRSFQRRATRALSGLSGVYDAVFSSYSPWSVHHVAHAAMVRGIARKWIADFRDEVTVPFGYLNGYKRRYLAMLRREPQLITGATDGVLAMMDMQGRVLNNGFDREDLPPAEDLTDGGRSFTAVYCGQFGMGRRGVPARDITPCLMALRALIDRGVISKEELRLVYAGSEENIFRRYAALAGLEDCVTGLGRVSRQRSLSLQRGASLLMMASTNTASQYGILTGKLFEYLMMDKPIVCCMAGDAAGSSLKRVLGDTGAGFCWEAANADADSAALESWLNEIISAWKQDLPLSMAKNSKQIEGYAYPQLATLLLDWIHDK